jgi:hypothetical protein
MRSEKSNMPGAIRSILRLRRAERAVHRDVRSEIRLARRFLETIAGPTVRPSEAARLLGVSQPALKRWLDQGEIAGVLTPEGRREIPLPELIGLLDEIDELGDEGGARPLARVIRERHRRSAETVDLERLLPRRRRGGTHRTAELQALAYHRLLAERLDEAIVDEARDRLRPWQDTGRIHPRWAREWEQILSRPVPRIARAISADSEWARELRQTSPFAGLLNEQERQRLTRAVEERALA